MAHRFTDGIWQEHVSVASANAGIFALKAFLKTAGWTVAASGDATTLFASSDGITVSGSGAGGLNNSGSWFRIQCPDGIHEMTVQRTSATNLYRVKTANFPFTGGSQSATQTPTAVGEVVRLGGGTDASPTGGAWWDNTSFPHNFFAGADREYPYGVYSSATETTTVDSHRFEFIPIISARETDDDPYLWRFGSTSAGIQGLDSSGTNIATWEAMTWETSIATEGDDPDGAELNVCHQLIGDQGTATVKGYNGLGLTGSMPTTGSERQVHNEAGEPIRTLIRIANQLFPWSGTLPSGYTDAGVARVWSLELALLIGGGSPTLENLTPAPGEIDTDEEVGRFVPITGDLTITAALVVPQVYARLGTPHTWHLVFDGSRDPNQQFAPLFAEHSTVEQTGDVWSFSILPTGGWWTSPIEVVFGQFLEATVVT